MASVADLELSDELRYLEENATAQGWPLTKRSPDTFLIGLPAQDGSMFWLLCEHDRYPGMPPAWHWSNNDASALDQLRDTPIENGGFLHGSGVICAPWNRLAYRSMDQRGLHGDWQIGDWRNNSYTLNCKTIPAMALRIFYELQKKPFRGRKAA